VQPGDGPRVIDASVRQADRLGHVGNEDQVDDLVRTGLFQTELQIPPAALVPGAGEDMQGSANRAANATLDDLGVVEL